jgi:hypothetical protein
VESVEWFMSDAPMRRYKEFAEVNNHDKRIKTLQETGKGFDHTIGTWLNSKSELTLHCAILSNPDKEYLAVKYLPLLKHLISVSPESLEQKSSEGFTPLQLAVFTGREDAVKYFISIGANQRHRDKSGRNMLHTMVANYGNSAKIDTKKLQAMLNLFDESNFAEMLVERCAEIAGASHGALTPLAFWLARNRGQYHKTDFLRVLCQYSNGEELEMINGEGDLPLHVVCSPYAPLSPFPNIATGCSTRPRQDSRLPPLPQSIPPPPRKRNRPYPAGDGTRHLPLHARREPHQH